MIRLNGAAVAEHIMQTAHDEYYNMWERRPVLATVLIGDNPASQKYVNNKQRDCQKCDIDNRIHYLDPAITTIGDVMELLQDLNNSPYVDGILVQYPIPDLLDFLGKTAMEKIIPMVINPEKDVDCFSPMNIGLLCNKYEKGMLAPCTAQAVIDILKYYEIPIAGQNVVIINRSNIVGKPLIQLMLAHDANVIVCHSKTSAAEKLGFLTLADIVVTATGHPNTLDPTYLHRDAVVIDVSMNVNEAGKLCGDMINPDLMGPLQETIRYTPVPGGVGPVTRAELIRNVFLLAAKRNEKGTSK